jgi:hypothetical protein
MKMFFCDARTQHTTNTEPNKKHTHTTHTPVTPPVASLAVITQVSSPDTMATPHSKVVVFGAMG